MLLLGWKKNLQPHGHFWNRFETHDLKCDDEKWVVEDERYQKRCNCGDATTDPHLSLLIKGHDHHCSAVALHSGRSEQEVLLSFLQADAVDDALPLAALQPSFNHREVGGVDAQRYLQEKWTSVVRMVL